MGVGRLIRCFCHPAVVRDHRQGVGVLGEGRTDRLIAVEGDRGGVGGPAQVASPAGEGITCVGCSFYAHHVTVVVGASRGCRDRAAGRRSDRQGDDIQIEGRTDRLIAVEGASWWGWSVPLRSPVQPVKV